MQRNRIANFLPYLVVILAVISLLGLNMGASSERISYYELQNVIEKEKVDEVSVSIGTNVTVVKGVYEKDKQKVTFTATIPSTSDQIEQVIKNLGNESTKLTIVDADASNIFLETVVSIIPFILFAVFAVWMLNRMNGANGANAKAFEFSKSRAKLEGKIRVRFSDVAGCDEEKQEMAEIIDYLKYPKKFEKMGARIPKGILLSGHPGTGKTLLAKAVAGEANVPFYSISGSDFVEMFVGVGASRVRDMFKKAQQTAPCIIFIDEIDAVGRQRGAGFGGGHDEREQTLNQLLVEMDGFGANEGIITIAATNRPDILDPALLRPGRFDRRVVVGRPDLAGRIAILKVHARNKPLDSDINLDIIAKKIPGFTGADIANLLNEAALLAARQNRKTISMADMEEASEKVSYGPERKSHKVSDSERRLTAYHESGHAIMATVLKEADPVHKVTIIPRGQAGGYTMMLPHEERSFITKAHLLAQLRVALGGRCAEQIVFKEISSGASGDLQQVTGILRKMIMEWGMSDRLGPMIFGEHQEQIFLGKQLGSERNYGETVATIIDEEMHKYLDEAYNDTMRILTENIEVLEAMAQALLEVETINHKQVENLFKYHSIYAPGEEPKQEESEFSPPPMDDGYGLPSFTN